VALSAALLVTLPVWAVSPAQAAAPEGCGWLDVSAGTCVDASIQDGGVALGGSQTAPGNGAPPSGAAAPPGPGNVAPNGAAPVVAPAEPNPFPDRTWVEFTVTIPVQLSDLVNFRPAPGTSHMEPKGWTILGVETNFFSQAAVQVQDGELLGQPASVRFTPVRFRWSYGDGTVALLRTRGGTWASQHIPEFDKTDTSHRYRAVGTYDVEHTVEFAAEYRYADGPWTPIAGTIPTPANHLVVSVGGARTVLVARECTRNPAGSGC
jgi:hypothetical protein